jgi:hypothetical protein
MRILVGVIALAAGVFGCGQGPQTLTHPPVAVPVSDVVQIDLLPSAPGEARLALSVAGNRDVTAEFISTAAGSSPLIRDLLPGFSTEVVVPMRADRSWDEAGTVNVKLRYAGQPAADEVANSISIPPSLGWLEPGAVYVMPLKTDVTVGEDVPLLVLQGPPEGLLSSLKLTIDCGGPVSDATVRGLGILPTLDLSGAWLPTHTPSVVLPLEILPEIYLELHDRRLVSVEIEPGSGSINGPPLVANVGALFSVNVRYSSPGVYAVSLPGLAGDHFKLGAATVGVDTQLDWRSYGTFPPGVPDTITVR